MEKDNLQEEKVVVDGRRPYNILNFQDFILEEGKKDTRDNTLVSLQQGHMDPRKSLTLDNTIPQCAYCNRTYLDYFRFNEHGRVIAVNNPEILLQSPRDIQDEMIEVLLKERQKCNK